MLKKYNTMKTNRTPTLKTLFSHSSCSFQRGKIWLFTWENDVYHQFATSYSKLIIRTQRWAKHNRQNKRKYAFTTDLAVQDIGKDSPGRIKKNVTFS